MNLLKIQLQPQFFNNSQTSPHRSSPSPPHSVSLTFPLFPNEPNFPLKLHPSLSPILLSTPNFKPFGVSKIEASICNNEETEANASAELEDLAPNGVVYQNTLRLVECSMFAAITGLAYFLSNSLAIENYFGCFFSLPIVLSSMRWGVAAGRKTMVATAMLLFVLSGPVKALTYLLMHGLVGFAMGSLWRLGANWSLSIFVCTLVRAMGAMGYLVTSSFLIRENIYALITINIHASLSFVFTSLGLNTPSMSVIYAFFWTLLLLNSGFFMFLLHLLYSVFLVRLGMKASLNMPRWLDRAI